MKTVLCHGCWDVLHYGHLKHLEKAKSYGDRLIVSITADRWINKGPGRPYFSAEKRAAMVKALSCVDEVFISDEPTAIGAIRRFQPNIFIKGQDYKDPASDPTGEIINEKKEVESYGGQVIFTDEETFSSSKIINQVFQPWSADQQRIINIVQDLGGIRSIKRAIEEISLLRVLVVGEPILDTYRFVSPEGISSKSPSISCRFEREETYEGGSTAIACHLGDFCEADLMGWDKFPEKTRYIAGNQRVFEVTKIDDSYREWKLEHQGYDVYVVADFGHGMFRGGELDGLKGFVGLNVQTNSSNYGYNVYTKHKRFDYLCLDTREGRLALHDRYSEPLTVAHDIASTIKRPFGFTCGSSGAYLIYGASTYHAPAFTDNVVDATGAGDAYFAITTVLLATGCDPTLVPFIGNVFAGLKCKIIGNKESVKKASLLKACEALLK